MTDNLSNAGVVGIRWRWYCIAMTQPGLQRECGHFHHTYS